MPDWRSFVRRRLHLPELKNNRDERIIEEIAGQLQDLYDTALARGSTEPEAEQRALDEFPDWDRLAGEIAAAERPNRRPVGDEMLERTELRLRSRGRLAAWLADLIQDIHLAARQMRHRPGFAAAVVLSLGLGIGANVALFEIASSVLRPDVPMRNPDRLTQVYMMWDHGNVYAPFSIPDYVDLRDGVEVFDDVAAWGINAFNVGVDGPAVRTWGAMISGNYFRTLGVSTELGRDFLPEEYAVPERNPVVLVSHSFWQRRLGADLSALGRTVTVNGSPFTVIGVVEREFRGGMVGTYSDIYVPLMMCQSALPGWSYFGRSNHWLTSIVARLKQGVTIDQAQEEVEALMAGLRSRYPESNRGGDALVISMKDSLLHPGIRTGFQAVFALLAAVVGVLMLLTCANVAGLMLARSAARQREFVMRIALGASRSRLIRQILSESLLYAFAAGCVGLVLVILVVPVVVSIQPPVDVPIQFGAQLGVMSAWTTLLVSLFAAILFGLAPALAAGRKKVASSLASGRTTESRPQHRLRHLLVAGQIAASLLLLVGASLGIRSLQELRRVDLGFDPENQLVLRLDLNSQGYDETTGRAFYRDLKKQLLETPGVEDVGLSKRILLNFDRSISLVWPEGWESPNGRPESISRNLIDGGYFDTMRIPLVEGRGFNSRDVGETGRVIVVNQRFADQYWPNQSAVGKRVRLHNRDDGPVYEVVGVVTTGKYQSIGEDPEPYFYRSFTQSYDGDMCVHVRTARDPELFFGDVRQIVASLDPELALSRLTTMSGQLQFALLPSRMIAWSVLVFASAALLLTAIGLYGLIAYTVAQQTREIGIRMAVGAKRKTLIVQVLGRILKHAVVGLGVGLGLALLGSVLVSRVLYGVTPLDPISVGASLAILCTVATLASLSPASRATRIDPVAALNRE